MDTYKVVKTEKYLKGITNAVPIIGKELESKLGSGEVIEINKDQLDVLKKRQWVTLDRLPIDAEKEK